MGFLDYFFNSKKKAGAPIIQFGRFSDAYKTELKYDAWDQALTLFEDGDHLQAYAKFFDYLRDDMIGNVEIERQSDQIIFTLYQGSKKIVGKADKNAVVAEAKIAKTSDLHIGFTRKLMEENFHLKYCRYALDEANNITAIFSTSVIDGSPYKLYYALKELATHADKKDDILVSEFDSVHQINHGHIREISDEERQLKYKYLCDEIDAVLAMLDKTSLNIHNYPGAESYAFLDLVYRLDYLLKPEGNTMEIIDEIHNMYFQNQLTTPEQKNRAIRKEVKKIRKATFEEFTKEIYEVKSTFGVTQPSGLVRIQEFIASELKNMDWYYANKHDDFARCIPSYIVGYALYNFSMPAPMRDLFNLYYQITDYGFFVDLGIDGKYRSGKGLDKSKIIRQIKAILDKYDEEYPALAFDTRVLVFTDLCLLCKSYLIMIQKMNFTRKDQR